MNIGKKSKEYLGIALETDRIYTARLRKAGGIMELIDVETLELPEPLEQNISRQPEQETAGGEEESIFGLDEEAGESGTLDLEEEPDETEAIDLNEDAADHDSDDFDMADVDESAGETNEQVLASFFNRLAGKKHHIGVNIPAGKSILQSLTDVHPKKMKKRELEEYLFDKLHPIYPEGVSNEQYNYEIDSDGFGWLISFDNDRSLLNLVDEAARISESKLFIHEMLSDEVLWAGMARMHARLEEDEITALVSIGKESSRVMFLKGEQVFHVLPVINEKASSGNILETIFSKLLFEMDKGTLPELHRLLIMQCVIQGEEAEKYFREQLEDVEVALFQPDPEKLQIPEHMEGRDSALQPYWSAIGAAWVASGADTDRFPALSLLPGYIRERQRVFKLEWHGMILLFLIALAPLLINYWFQQRSDELDTINRSVNLLEARISDTRPVAEEVERLTAEHAVYAEHNERITELAANNLLWSVTLDRLNRGLQQLQGIWLTTLEISGEDLMLDGYSIYRRQIPQLSGIFRRGHITQVTEGEMRDRTIYRFSVRVSSFGEDTLRFSPELPEPDEEQIREIPRNDELNFEDPDE